MGTNEDMQKRIDELTQALDELKKQVGGNTPAVPPVPTPPKKSKGSGKGCLIALIIVGGLLMGLGCMTWMAYQLGLFDYFDEQHIEMDDGYFGNVPTRPLYNDESSQSTNKVVSKEINGHEYVDLGLSVKWATCNVGAEYPEDYGDYYAWGETSTKYSYTVDNSVTYRRTVAEMSGDATYDVARAKWGGTWRLPTESEIEELLNCCTWVWMTKNGYNVYKVTGPSGNSIFLPAAGLRYESSLFDTGSKGYYWGSTPDDRGKKSCGLYFDSSRHSNSMINGKRYCGFSVRPVSE